MAERVALVTGGIGGLGSAICKRLATGGHRVVVADIDAEEKYATQWLRESREQGYDFILLAVDVADLDSCLALEERVRERVGRVDILVNCAGITRDGVFKKMEPAQWQSVLRTNLEGVFNVSRQFIGEMMERGFGRIVNIASTNGQKGQFGQTNYAAASAGIHGFTMSLALEVAGKGVTVNTISPGYVATPMVMAIPEDIRGRIVNRIPVGRLGSPEEVAALVAFLVGDEAGFITGTDISVNGGQHMF